MSISIVLQISNSITNLSWKFLLSRKDAKAKYWYLMSLDALLCFCTMIVFSLYPLGAWEANSFFMSIVAHSKWERKKVKIYEFIVNALMLLVCVWIYIEHGFSEQFMSIILFVFFLNMLKNKNRYGWLVLLVGQLIMLYSLWNAHTYIMFASLSISTIFSIRGFANWKKNRI